MTVTDSQECSDIYVKQKTNATFKYVHLRCVYIQTYSHPESESKSTALLEYSGTPANQIKVIDTFSRGGGGGGAY